MTVAYWQENTHNSNNNKATTHAQYQDTVKIKSYQQNLQLCHVFPVNIQTYWS